MKHVAIFGAGPLPDAENGICSAAGLRTQQFLKTLSASYRVLLFTIGGKSHEGKWIHDTHFEIARESKHLMKRAKEMFRQNDIDVVIGVNTFPAFVASQVIPEDIPFWADLNGWIMAEMQAQSSELGHDHYLGRGWEQERSILLRADQISTVSTPQKHAVWGELATLGRLNKDHFQQNFVHVIPNAQERSDNSKKGSETSHISSLLREKGVPENAFLVAQIGGFNNWFDEETLFHSFEKVMEQDESVHFVSTGGNIEHVATHPFIRFTEKVHASPHRDRFHFLGWVDGKDIPEVYALSDIGVMADIDCIETRTGARNRLNEMMMFGLPMVTTEGSEISFDIKKWECGYVVESGNSTDFAKAILALKDAGKRQTCMQNAQRICNEVLTYERTTGSLLTWISQDNIALLHLHRVQWEGASRKLKSALQFLRERGFRAFVQKIWQKIRRK